MAVLRAQDDAALQLVPPPETDPRGLDGVRADVVAAGRALDRGRPTRGTPPQPSPALDEHRVLCAHRRGPYGVARWTGGDRTLARPPTGAIARAGRGAPGRPVLVTSNDYDIGLFNGDTGVVVATDDGPRVAFARGGAAAAVRRRPGSPRWPRVHAMTVHRGQGSQFRGVTVVLPPAESPLLTRELLYTAVTRARSSVRIVGTEESVRAAVARPVARASGLRERLG